MGERPDLSVTLAVAARRLNAHDDLDATAAAIVATAPLFLPCADQASVVLGGRRGALVHRAASAPLAAGLDALQLQLGEGPSPAAVEETEPVSSLLRHEQRWPDYVAQAVRRGVRSQLSLRLHVDDEVLGVLTVYSLTGDVTRDDVREPAESYAVQSALALRRVRREEQLSAALQARKVIGQAIGIVMERYAMDEDRAFRYISRLSQDGNVKLRDLAQQLVAERNAATDASPADRLSEQLSPER